MKFEVEFYAGKTLDEAKESLNSNDMPSGVHKVEARSKKDARKKWYAWFVKEYPDDVAIVSSIIKVN